MAKSIIKHTIRRKIRTADFESLDADTELQEEIEWETEEERIQEAAKVRTRVLEYSEQTYNEACQKYGVDRCIGVVNVKAKGGNKNSKKTEETVDFDF